MFINHHWLPLHGQKWLRTSRETRPLTNASKNHLQIIETIQNRVIDITNEIAKVQPKYAQSLSNLPG